MDNEEAASASGPPGEGPGWRSLSEVADHAIDVFASDVDPDDMDEFEEFCDLPPEHRVRTLYTRSDCDDFAAALHRVTGWPVVTVRFMHPTFGMGHHTLAQAPDGRLLDAGGWHERANVRKSHGGKRRGVEFGEPGDEDSCGHELGHFDDGGVDHALSLALSAIRQLPWAPFNEPWFQAMSSQPQTGADISAMDGDEPADPRVPGAS